MIRNIIFDWSGTLVDDLPAVWEASNFVLAQAGRPRMPLDEFRVEFCLPFTLFYQKHVPHIGMPQLESWFHGRFREIQSSVRPQPHSEEFLRYCRDHQIRTFLLSTIAGEHYALQARTTGLGQYLDVPYTGIWDKREKIRELLAENRLTPSDTLLVGDMQHDIDTARHGGTMSCAVLTGYNTIAQLECAHPDLLVANLGELQSILEHQGRNLRTDKLPTTISHPVVTVGALIHNSAGQILLVRTHKWSHRWGIPGGKIKWGEASETALRRELKEETNLDIERIKFVMAQDCIHSTEFHRDAHFVLLNYTCYAPPGQEVRLNEEAQEARWISPNQALTLPLNRPTRNLISALRQNNPPNQPPPPPHDLDHN